MPEHLNLTRLLLCRALEVLFTMSATCLQPPEAGQCSLCEAVFPSTLLTGSIPESCCLVNLEWSALTSRLCICKMAKSGVGQSERRHEDLFCSSNCWFNSLAWSNAAPHPPASSESSFSAICVHAKSLQSCPTLCDPMDCNLLGSSVYGMCRQKYWSGLPCPPPGDLPVLGIKPTSLGSAALAGPTFFPSSATWEVLLSHSLLLKAALCRVSSQCWLWYPSPNESLSHHPPALWSYRCLHHSKSQLPYLYN